MNEQNQPEPKNVTEQPADDTGGILYSSFFKITDTTSGQVLLSMRDE